MGYKMIIIFFEKLLYKRLSLLTKKMEVYRPPSPHTFPHPLLFSPTSPTFLTPTKKKLGKVALN